MDLISLAILAVGLSFTMAGAWAVQRATGSSGWIDTIWSFAVGLGGIAAAYLPAAGAHDGRRAVVAVLIALWSLRLGLHIAARTRGAGEDPRYAALLEAWGADASRRLFLFLQIQAAAAFLLVVAVRAAAVNPVPFPRLLDFVGIAVAAVAVGGEALADAQLARFRRDNPGRGAICEIGLWAWSRHPNYFFEWLGWCAYALVAVDLGGGHPAGWLAFAAPAFMYVLLVHVSGIPPLEAHMVASRGAAYRALQGRVNAFFPGPRRTSTTPSKSPTSNEDQSR